MTIRHVRRPHDALILKRESRAAARRAKPHPDAQVAVNLYNAVLGVNELAPLPLDLLGLSAYTIPRLRECWLENGEIVVYTRTGGSNREKFTNENSTLMAQPLYRRNRDDEYDNIYAKWYFAFPQQFDALKTRLLASPHACPPQPSERWKALIGKFKHGDENDPEVQKAFAVGRIVFAVAKPPLAMRKFPSYGARSSNMFVSTRQRR